jgi:hypothetical protein
MALNFTRSKRAPAESVLDPYGVSPLEPISTTPIPTLADDPEHARLTAQVHTLDRALQERQHTIERYAIRQELSANSTLATGERKTMLRDRLAKLDIPASIPEAKPDPATEGLDPVVAVALRLAAGEEVEPPRDRDQHIQQLRTEIRTLEDAARIVRVQLEELREVRSIAVAEMVLPQQREILRAKLDALLAVAAAVQTERRLIAEILQSGHVHCPGIMKSPPIDPANRLGSTSEYDSPISTYRRTLEMLGVVWIGRRRRRGSSRSDSGCGRWGHNRCYYGGLTKGGSASARLMSHLLAPRALARSTRPPAFFAGDTPRPGFDILCRR